MTTFKTFKRSATSFEEMVKAKKIHDKSGLTYEEARQRCQEFNSERSELQKRNGTKMEFTEE